MLRALKARDTHQKLADTKLERWDVGYYSEKALRAKFSIDEEQFRQYFPSDASVKFVFRIATRNGPATTMALLDAAAQINLPVHSLSVQSTTLDDVFVHYTGRQLRDALQEASPLDSSMMMRR